jgi:type 1 glutamine amidotransferase
LEKYDLIVFNYFNFKAPTLSDQAKENLAEFIRGGKGFVTFHLSSASFSEWPEWRKICGRNWIMGTSGHGPYGEFEAEVVKDHPITKGVAKKFKTEDELYAKLQGDEDINVLVSAYSDWSKKVEPLAFTVNYGKGRVYHHAFGHKVVSITNEPVAKLFAQGAEWAANGKVE